MPICNSKIRVLINRDRELVLFISGSKYNSMGQRTLKNKWHKKRIGLKRYINIQYEWQNKYNLNPIGSGNKNERKKNEVKFKKFVRNEEDRRRL